MPPTQHYSGGCHCGNIKITLNSKIAPSDFRVLACQCGFCRKHATRAIADPQGSIEVTIADDSTVNRYAFGLKTADYLLCRTCGVYVLAVTKDSLDPRGIVIADSLDERAAFSAPAIAVTYDGESLTERQQRRQKNWTPVTFLG